MKVKITVVADIEGLPDSDMYTEIQERITAIPYVNGVETVHIDPVMTPIKRKRG